MWGPVGRTGVTPGFLHQVRRACLEAIRKAHSALKPASLRIATADINSHGELIGDSRLPTVIDSTLTVIQARDDAGTVIATVVNVPCHPEALGSRNNQLSSGFPSSLRHYLEEQYGGTAIYNSGTIGGLLSPRVPKEDPFTHAALGTDTVSRMQSYGQILGRIAESALAEARPLHGPIRARSREVLIPVWNPVYKTAASMYILDRPMYDHTGSEVHIPKIGDKQPATTSRPELKDLHLKTEVALLEIGSLQVAAVPGELYPEIELGKYQRPQDPSADFPGAPLEPPLLAMMTGEHKMIIGLANDEIGYIIPKSQWDWDAPFAYGRKERQYGEFNSCGPDVAPKLMEAFQSLIAGR